MTLIISVTTKDSLWMLADRRLSYRLGIPPRDDGRKIMTLRTKDGMALLGYAGLGATAKGSEPADWMSSVLRGRSLTLEESLGVLADAMKRQLPRHLLQLGTRNPNHEVHVTAMVGKEPRYYRIGLTFTNQAQNPMLEAKRYGITKLLPRRMIAPPIHIGGSGSQYFMKRDGRWGRELLHLIRASEKGQIADTIVSDYLSKLNLKVHHGLQDRSVGPNAIVTWHHRQDGPRKGGGGISVYEGTVKVYSPANIPAIIFGRDQNAIIDTLSKHANGILEVKRRTGTFPKPDNEALKAELSKLPMHPDETFD